MVLTKVQVFSGTVTEDTTGITSGAASLNTQGPGKIKGTVVGAEINVTATAGTTPTLDAKVQMSSGDGVWIDLVTFTQVTTSTGRETLGVDSSWTDILNPSGANPGAVDTFAQFRTDANVNTETDASYTYTVHLLVQS